MAFNGGPMIAGAYAADGIFRTRHLSLTLARNLVIATNSSWTTAMGYDEHPKARGLFPSRSSRD